jgi:nicotinate-nucleotide adenylyltransferase
LYIDSMSLLGILGGTFDPIHYGHLRPAREARAALQLDTLNLVPAAEPPHRHAPVASAGQRLAMARLALEEFPELSVDDRELRMGGPSYTVRTLESFRAEWGDTVPLCLLMGSDAFEGLTSWHQWQRLPELAHVVVLQRPGWDEGPEDLPSWCRGRVCEGPGELRQAPAGRVYFLAVSPQDISATALRRDIAAGIDVSRKLPGAVLKYIREQGLYRNNNGIRNAG